MQSIYQASEFYSKSKELFESASMNLRDRMSNSVEVLHQIAIHDRANRERMKILGLTCTVKEDTLALTSNKQAQLCLKEQYV